MKEVVKEYGVMNTYKLIKKDFSYIGVTCAFLFLEENKMLMIKVKFL